MKRIQMHTMTDVRAYVRSVQQSELTYGITPSFFIHPHSHSQEVSHDCHDIIFHVVDSESSQCEFIGYDYYSSSEEA